MSLITKPNLENVWASEGGIGDPDISQILEGWAMNQTPPSEIANFLQNRVEMAIRYLLQQGVSEWYSNISYKKGSLTNLNGTHYIALEENLNKSPESNPTVWRLAWDSFGASDDLREIVNAILTQDGYLGYYVKKSDPVMSNKAKAPSFEADVGVTSGFRFKNYTSNVTCVGGELIFTADGVVNGRIKKDAPTLDSNDSTLVTTALLKQVIDDVIAETRKASQLPIGYSIVTRHRKPPSEKDQLGYGIWELDCQGRALVGVSVDTAVTTPEWVKDADSKEGEYKHTQTVEEMPPHRHDIGGRWQDGGSGGVQGGNKSVEYVTSTNETGGGKPFNIVQPSHTKFIWTRVG